MFIGVGTVANVATVLVGGIIGLVAGDRLPQATRTLLTQVMGLFTLVIAGYAVVDGMSEDFAAEAGNSARFLIVLGSLVVGGIIGSGLQLEAWLEKSTESIRAKLAGIQGKTSTPIASGQPEAATPTSSALQTHRFTEGAVTATLIFCVGPLSILGSLSDGMGSGADQLLVKAIMDGVTSMALASVFGIGVFASVIPLALYQGTLTLIGALAGQFLSAGQIDALGATGGVILLGLAVRLLGLKQVAVADLLPALILAPAITALVALLN